MLKHSEELTDGINVGFCEGIPEGNDEWDGTNDGVVVGRSEGKS